MFSSSSALDFKKPSCDWRCTLAEKARATKATYGAVGACPPLRLGEDEAGPTGSRQQSYS